MCFQNIREQKGLAYSVFSQASSLAESGYFNIYAGVSHDKIQDAIGGIKEELENLRKLSISEEELIVAKEQMKANYIFGQENVSTRMFSLGKNLSLINKVFSPEEVISGLDGVTMEDIRQVSELISDVSRYSAIAVTNKKSNIKKIILS